jgi:hypothetical protein
MSIGGEPESVRGSAAPLDGGTLAAMRTEAFVLLLACVPACDAGGATDAGPGADTPSMGIDAPGVDSPAAGSDTPSTDPYESARQACVDEINRLRGTVGLPPLARWRGVEGCMDAQANADQMSGTPHGAWSSRRFPECNGNGQNECLGAGASGVVSCLNSMWDERLQAGCSGCDACRDAYDPSCPNCDFYGRTTGDVCGHYVNMSALYFSEVACGFSTTGGWVTINFR